MRGGKQLFFWLMQKRSMADGDLAIHKRREAGLQNMWFIFKLVLNQRISRSDLPKHKIYCKLDC